MRFLQRHIAMLTSWVAVLWCWDHIYIYSLKDVAVILLNDQTAVRQEVQDKQ